MDNNCKNIEKFTCTLFNYFLIFPKLSKVFELKFLKFAFYQFLTITLHFSFVFIMFLFFSSVSSSILFIDFSNELPFPRFRVFCSRSFVFVFNFIDLSFFLSSKFSIYNAYVLILILCNFMVCLLVQIKLILF